MSYTIVFLALLAGLFLGILTGWFWFSKGKKISSALQAEIDKKERELQDAEVKIVETRSKLKAVEAESRSTAKEILSEAKIAAQELENKVQKEAARVEEQGKFLDRRLKDVEEEQKNVIAFEAKLKETEKELTDASQKHREALERVAKLAHVAGPGLFADARRVEIEGARHGAGHGAQEALGLTDAQKEQLKTRMEANRPVQLSPAIIAQMKTDMTTKLDSFKSDSFDARAFVTPPANWLKPTELKGHPLADLVSVLTPERRETLAKRIEAGPAR